MSLFVRFVFILGLLMLVRSSGAVAQVRPSLPHRAAMPPPAPRSTPGPSAWRNSEGAQPATTRVQPLSKQDRRAYENCPDPARFGPKNRRRLVRIH